MASSVWRMPRLYIKCNQEKTNKSNASRLHAVERSHVYEARLGKEAASGRWRGNAQQNLLPEHSKNETELRIFKLGLRTWVMENVLISQFCNIQARPAIGVFLHYVLNVSGTINYYYYYYYNYMLYFSTQFYNSNKTTIFYVHTIVRFGKPSK